MTGMEKVAWTELIVSLVTVIVVIALVPWLGTSAQAGFAIMGFVAFGYFFIRRRGSRVVTDERDSEIEQKAIRYGVSVAWTALFTSLILVIAWSGTHEISEVPIALLSWLLWSQFVIAYGVKGLSGVLMHRRQRIAAQ
ncbi:MAG: DUF2178 domain-containing protein [Candidatus Omnitrophica bacterium]|nr:DUF2178 domain-containing protein [Candidatus Omnitrophota bacterium]MCA9426690.1 DUF2178 domain-containing protein [Candidatus Omnitrophota bacterium]MCA9432396.1 DUF2178 domain-containing protein [Candidatus Omnitrophota bacterium]MCA9436697.1 DUF2178 domain-containing protein [Candidatus Omnitrophota bacterium]MCA9441646.1 DUF2178 domain-containing protein [Candidatus Omnitrophota bacterium]